MVERVRFTIAVDPDVHEAFQEMSKISGQSLSRCVGDWLKDTSQPARLINDELRRLKASPADALEKLGRLQVIAARETEALVKGLRSGKLKLKEERPGGLAWRAERAREAARARKPPSSHTGVNTPAKGRTK